MLTTNPNQQVAYLVSMESNEFIPTPTLILPPPIPTFCYSSLLAGRIRWLGHSCTHICPFLMGPSCPLTAVGKYPSPEVWPGLYSTLECDLVSSFMEIAQSRPASRALSVLLGLSWSPLPLMFPEGPASEESLPEPLAPALLPCVPG